jgi:hypothetical protein
MGAWGTGNFENDGALDWVYDLVESNDLTLILNMIHKIIEEEYIESDDGENGLMAIEAIARLKGNFGKDDSYAESMNTWVKSHPLEISNELLTLSNQALNKIEDEENSELYELWEEEDLTEWLEVIKELRSRLI